MTRRHLVFLAGLLLAGCASLPQQGLRPRAEVEAFAIEARFALRVTPADQPPRSSSGRLSWQHQPDSDWILLANPLGHGIAEIESRRQVARLRTADGQHREAADADALTAEVTGQRLPVTRLPAWLLGRSPATRLDAQGRPQQANEDGWQIDYVYDHDGSDALPSGLTLRRAEEIELRLRIEEWKTP